MEFKLPDIGEGVHEGEITRWLVKTGDPIAADEPMVEIMTDKATVEIPSPVSGVVEAVFAKEGETVPVGKVIIVIREGAKLGTDKIAPGASRDTPMAVKEKPVEPTGKPRLQKEPEVARVEEESSNLSLTPMILATPATRKLARDLEIDLQNVGGTGLHGRITKEDVRLAYETRQAAYPRPSHPAPVTAHVVLASSQKTLVSRGEIERVALRGVRKRIAEAMTHSKHTAAHFTYVEEVDMTEIVKLRASVMEEAKTKDVKLTYLPFIIKSLIPALVEFPYLNASLDDEKQEIILKGDYNIGIATDTEQGLIVPVIHQADRKSIWEIAREISTLVECARAGTSLIEDLKGGSFTITNAGSLGGMFATPIINHPEVAILGVNAIRKRPVVQDDAVVIRDMMYLSLSVDHRVVDGADAARFMNRLVYFLSVPTRLVFA
jgi:pyruvate dehydrogenase E2 component (dihydrolipoamide acetyltransferase)